MNARELVEKLFTRAIFGFSKEDEALIESVKAYLAQPEQEPVAWQDKLIGNLHYHHDVNSIPLYTAPPDQSARIAELLDKLGGASAQIMILKNELSIKAQQLATLQAESVDLHARVAELTTRLRIAEDILHPRKQPSDYVTADDWRRKAEWMEYNWRSCSAIADSHISELKGQLAATQTERKPLSPKEIELLEMQCTDVTYVDDIDTGTEAKFVLDTVKFARAIEQAHNITGEQ